MVDTNRDDIGEQIHALARRLYPICRSLTGNGVRQTLAIIGETIPLTVHEVATGTRAFDWEVPKEWNITDAYVLDEQGKRVIDFMRCNLHVVGYSIPVDAELTLDELLPRLHSEPDQPDAIPYVTSYYNETWGFCVSLQQRQNLTPQNYHVKIDSTLQDGHLTYAELLIPGSSSKEIFLSTYVCHPSMGNNELSGPCVVTFLARWIAERPRRYSYRIVFIPETIGSLVYLSRNLQQLQERTLAGFNVTCVGDDRSYSYVSTRYGNTLADRVIAHVLRHRAPDHRQYSFLSRGSDERQYCSPGVDLPVVTVCRSKFAEYPEYHTSLDDLNLVTPGGLQGGFDMVCDCIEVLEHNATYRATCNGEPQLGKRGLYPTMSRRNNYGSVKDIMNFLAYADGDNDLLAIAELIDRPAQVLWPIAERLIEHGLIEEIPDDL